MLKLKVIICIFILFSCHSDEKHSVSICFSEVISDLVNDNGYSLFRIRQDQTENKVIEWKIGLVKDCLVGEESEKPFEVLSRYTVSEYINVIQLSNDLDNIDLVPVSLERLNQINSRTKMREFLMEDELDAFVLLFRPSESPSNQSSIISHTFWTGNQFTVKHVLHKSKNDCIVKESSLIR